MPQNDTVNRRIVLAAHPRSLPTLQDFRLDEVAVPTPNEGQVLLREDVVDGLENAPAAFIGLLEGRNFGKLVVRVASP